MRIPDSNVQNANSRDQWESIRFQASLLEAAGQAVVATDTSGSIVYWNSAAERIYGWSVGEAMGRSAWEVMLSEDMRERADEVRDRVLGGEVWQGEISARNRDGERVELLASSAPVYGEEGELIGVVGVQADITERKRMEEALRQSEERFRELYDAAFEGILIHDEEKILDVNRTLADMLGYEKQELVGRPGLSFVAPEHRQLVRKHIESGSEGPCEGDALKKDGTRLSVEARGRDIIYKGRRVRLANIRDISERKRVEETLRESERMARCQLAELRTIYDTAPVGLAFMDRALRFVNVNEELAEFNGIPVEEHIGKTLYEVLPSEIAYRIGSLQRRVLETGEPVTEQELRGETRARSDEKRDWLVSFHPTKNAAGEVLGINVIVQEVTERKRVEEKLRQSEERLRTIIEAEPECVKILDTEGRVLEMNPAVLAILEADSIEQLRGKPLPNRLVVPEHRPDFVALTQRVLSGESGRLEFEIVGLKGTHRWLETSAVPLRDDSGAITGLLGVTRDITERKVLEEQLAHQAFHDSLTGLPNRALFGDRLNHALTRSGRRDSEVAVLFADLDNFKAVNDGFGHELGDQLLVAVAERLESCLRPEDTLARFGGDEFIILLEEIEHPSDAGRVAGRIAERLREPFSLEGREVFVSASIGISFGSSADVSSDEMIRKADIAMYQAKRRGSGGYAMFEPDMQTRVLRRMEMEHDLRRAVEQQQFRLHYQPLVDLDSGRITGTEALVRWEHPKHGLISPGEFIPIAEETGLIIPMAKWVLEEACRQARAWRSEFASSLTVSVNLSLSQFHHPDLVGEVREALRRADLEPASLSLEITESVAMREPEHAAAILRELKELGVRLAIDDFGTGHSSLSYLIRRFRMDILKIDRSFIRELAVDSEYEKIISGILGLAQGLNLEVVAEGVEADGSASCCAR